jgi:hypothetical protein
MKTLAAALLALTLTACADPATVRPRAGLSGSPSTSSYAADGLVLQVSYTGGFLPADHLEGPPAWSLYGDGRVITHGAEPAIYPGRALPSLMVGRVEPGAVEEIADAARAAGIDGKKRDYGNPPVADASSTVFRLATADGYVETAVYALQESGGSGSNEARRKLEEFHRRLTGGEGEDGWPVSGEEAYVPTALAVVAQTPYRLDGEAEEQVQDWPGPALTPGYDLGEAGTCTVVAGADLDAVLPAVRKANILTRWTYDGADWRLRFRPLLPHERTCADAYGEGTVARAG